MALEDSITAYIAESNMEALMAKHHLEAAGIEAHVSEDNSIAGTLIAGRMSNFHKPEVWVSRADSQRAAELLAEFEEQKRARDPKRVEDEPKTAEANCERCEKPSTFAGSLNGTIQNCPHCGAFVDVGEYEWPEDFDVGEMTDETAG